MILIRQKYIFREDMKANTHLLYLWGDNEMRVGSGGQAKEMRGEPNGIGIRTKRKPLSDFDAYWDDQHYDLQKEMLDQDFQTVNDALGYHNGILIYRDLVLPLDGIGTGFAQLPERAPKTLAYLNMKLYDLARNIGSIT